MSCNFNNMRAYSNFFFDRYFENQQRAERSPGIEFLPNAFTPFSLFIGERMLSDRKEVATKIALPIIGALAMGFFFCKGNGYRVSTLLQEFVIDATFFATIIKISNSKDLSRHEKRLYIDVLFAVKACAILALDKLRNPTLPFTALCAHVILTTYVTRKLIYEANKNDFCKSERAVRNVVIHQVASIALALSIQSLMTRPLRFNWRMLGIEMVTKSILAFALWSPSSTIVKKFGP